MKGRIFLILFGLPFFGIGVWMLWSISSGFTDAWQMQSWQPTVARLIQAGYNSHSGDDSYTYEAYAIYAYTIGGQEFTSDRVSITGGADNIGGYQQDMGRKLSGAFSRGEAITIYVDPDDPREAIIDRDLRWGLIGFKSIFLFVFGGAGLGLIIWAFRAPKQKDTSAPVYRDQPWLVNDEWQRPTVKSNSKKTMYFTWVFPLVGIWLIVWAIRSTLEWRRFGPAPVTLDPFPGALNGHVGGTIDINLPYDSSANIMLTLTNLYSYVSGSGKNRSRREKAKWQDRQVAHTESGPKGTRLSFRFDVPAGLTESDADQSADAYHLWRLNLKADLPGVDIDRNYEIPVYATGEESRHISSRAIESARNLTDEMDDLAVRNAVQLQSGIGGKEMLYPAGRNIGPALAGLIVGAVFSAIGWYMIVSEEQGIFGNIFAAVFAGVGLLAILGSLYSVLNSLQVIKNATELIAVRRILGIPVKRASIRCNELVRFSKDSSFKSQSGNKHVVHYSIFAEDRKGEKIIVAEGFKGASEANAAIRFLTREFGLTPQEDDVNVGSDLEFDVLAADN
jgi:hypothetical protein